MLIKVYYVKHIENSLEHERHLHVEKGKSEGEKSWTVSEIPEIPALSRLQRDSGVCD